MLDEQLTGLDRDSDKAKAIVAEMAKLAAQVEAAEGQVDSLSTRLDGIKPGSVDALRKEVEELERAFEQTVVGTKEQEEALQKLGRAKGTLRELEDAIDALHPKERAAAFVDFANGVVGAFTVASTAAQTFGLSQSTVDEYQQKLQGLLVTMSALESISKATNSETLANVKSMLALARSYVTAGEGASTGAKITRAALISTGIGLLVVAVGLLISNWDKLTSTVKGSEAFFTKVKAVASGLFDSAIASIKNFAGVIGKVFEGDFSGAVAKAKNIGKEVGAAYMNGFQESIFESHRKEMEALVEAHARQIEVLKAQGQNTFKQEEQNLLAKLRLQKQGTEDEKKQYLDLQKDLAVLRAANAKKEREDSQAATLARLDARIALEQAKGEEAFQKQLAREKKQLAILQSAPDPNAAAIISQQNKIDTLIAQHDAQQAEKKRAALVLAQQNELALLEKQGKDTLVLRVTFAEQLLALDHDGTEKQRAQRDADYQALLLVEEEYNAKVREGLQANLTQRQDIAEQGREVDKKFIEGTADFLADAASKGLQKKDFNVGATILTKLFGVKPEDIEKVQAGLNKAFAEIAQSVGGAVNAILAGGIAEAQAQIDEVQTRLQQLDSQLSQASSERASTQAALENATGTRKTYLLEKLEKERAAEQRIASERARAAQQEAAAQKEKAKMEKEQQQIAAASTAIEATLLAIQAAQTVVKIASKGFTGWDNIALAIAGAATIGASIFAVKNAAKQFEAGTGALGSDGVLAGPAHAQGGIGLFNRYGHFYGEAEGGEAITPADSSRLNAGALQLIRTKGRSRQLTAADFAEISSMRVLPPPSGMHYANGTGALRRDSLGGMAGPTGGYASAADVSQLASQQQRTNALLEQVVAHVANTALFSQLTAEKPPIVPDHETALAYEQKAAEAKASQRAATL